jgi:hypothetical protein
MADVIMRKPQTRAWVALPRQNKRVEHCKLEVCDHAE